MSDSSVSEATTEASSPEEVAAPFDPATRKQVGGKGCGWMAAVGCGVLLLAGVALIATVAFNGDRLLSWSLERFEEQLLADAPEELGEGELEELRVAFDLAREHVRSGEVDPQELQSFQSLMLELAFKSPKERTAKDYRRLREALDSLAGESPVEEEAPEAPVSPEPAPLVGLSANPSRLAAVLT